MSIEDDWDHDGLNMVEDFLVWANRYLVDSGAKMNSNERYDRAVGCLEYHPNPRVKTLADLGHFTAEAPPYDPLLEGEPTNTTLCRTLEKSDSGNIWSWLYAMQEWKMLKASEDAE